MNRAKHTRNVTRRLSFGDRNVIANAGSVIAAFGERRNGGSNKKSNSEEKSEHRRPRGLSVRLELIHVLI
jgi:hypothetical protein